MKNKTFTFLVAGIAILAMAWLAGSRQKAFTAKASLALQISSDGLWQDIQESNLSGENESR